MNIRSRIERCILCGQRFFLGDPTCVHCEFCGKLKDDDHAGIFDRKTGDWFCNVRCRQRHLRFSEVWKHRPDLQESVSAAMLNAMTKVPVGED